MLSTLKAIYVLAPALRCFLAAKGSTSRTNASDGNGAVAVVLDVIVFESKVEVMTLVLRVDDVGLSEDVRTTDVVWVVVLNDDKIEDIEIVEADVDGPVESLTPEDVGTLEDVNGPGVGDVSAGVVLEVVDDRAMDVDGVATVSEVEDEASDPVPEDDDGFAEELCNVVEISEGACNAEDENVAEVLSLELFGAMLVEEDDSTTEDEPVVVEVAPDENSGTETIVVPELVRVVEGAKMLVAAVVDRMLLLEIITAEVLLLSAVVEVDVEPDDTSKTRNTGVEQESGMLYAVIKLKASMQKPIEPCN